MQPLHGVAVLASLLLGARQLRWPVASAGMQKPWLFKDDCVGTSCDSLMISGNRWILNSQSFRHLERFGITAKKSVCLLR